MSGCQSVSTGHYLAHSPANKHPWPTTTIAHAEAEANAYAEQCSWEVRILIFTGASEIALKRLHQTNITGQVRRRATECCYPICHVDGEPLACEERRMAARDFQHHKVS
jgi:hypothetical protein